LNKNKVNGEFKLQYIEEPVELDGYEYLGTPEF
jgi:hypothetical protein